jgi:hypothetical protein
VRVYDVAQARDRNFYSGTAQAITHNGWMQFTFDWSGVGTFPSNYILREVFVDIWGKMSDTIEGAVYLDEVIPLTGAAPTATRTSTATATATASKTATVTATATATATVTRTSTAPTPTRTATTTATATATRTATTLATATATATATQSLPAGQQRIPLEVGWNWFSFNVIPAPPVGADCSTLQTTPYFSHYYGAITLDGQAAPVGARVEMFSPRGDRVGCFVTTLAGIYPFTRVYGEDIASAIPGMRAGEAVTFKVNGVTATTSPTALWQDDKIGHQVDLVASSGLDVGAILASIAGKYNLVLSEEGGYVPPPADPRYNTLNTLAVGEGYLIRMTQAGEIVLNGSPAAADMPHNLAVGWNWIGYLPTNPLPVATALASIAGKYNLLLGQDGTYAPPPADPRFNTLLQMAPGAGYMIRMTQAATLIYPH